MKRVVFYSCECYDYFFNLIVRSREVDAESTFDIMVAFLVKLNWAG